MKFFKKINKKAFLSIFGMALLAFVASAHYTNASILGVPTNAGDVANAIGDVSYTVVGKIAFAIGYIIAAFAGIAIAIEAWLIGVVLNINAGVLQTTFVQTGFSISLAVANLAFVLGIIVIAIATILRSESYGIKKLLWKLVVAAILVNFGLVIMSPIFALGNSFTQYFLNCISPAAGGCNSTSSGLSSFNSFATTLTGAFNPQNGIVALNNINSSSSQALAGSGVSGLFAVSGQDLGKLIVPVVSIAFVVINSGLIAIVLGTLLMMLIVRYIYIAILAILMPFAWASWVFPGFESHWKKWWDTFLRWTFFGPIVLFFLYLALLTMSSLGNAQNSTMNFTTYTSSSNTVWAAISNYFTNIFSPIIQSSLQEVLLAGLIVGGLMAANSMGIKMAGSTVDFVQKQGKAAGNRIGGYANRKRREVQSKAVPEKLKNNLQAGAYRFVPKRLQVATGVGLENIKRSGKADIVSDEAKHAEELAKDPKQFARILGGKSGTFGRGSTNREAQMAMLAKLAKDEDLQKEVAKEGNMVGGKHLQEFLRDNEDEFKRLQQEKLYDTLKDKSGLTPLELAEKNKDHETTVLALGKKKELQEIKDIKQTAAQGDVVSPSELKKVEDFEKRKKDLEYFEKSGEGMSSDEKEELSQIRAMESTTGKYMTDGEAEKYKEAKDKFDENNGKIKGWVTKNPDVAADSFQDHDKARAKLESEGKPVPLTFDKGAVERVQESILTAMAEGFSPQNARGLIEAIGKKNNLKYFEGAMSNIESRDSERAHQIKDLAKSNRQLSAWIQKNPGKTVVDLNQMFGIKGESKKRRTNDDDDDEA